VRRPPVELLAQERQRRKGGSASRRFGKEAVTMDPADQVRQVLMAPLGPAQHNWHHIPNQRDGMRYKVRLERVKH